MKVLSLYCGAGGIDEGLKQAGIKTTLAIDSWSDACETFKLNHPEAEVINSNVSDVKESLGDFDLVVGGPPCPEFSRANINRSLDPCEVNHFWDIVEKTKAKTWIMENVQDVIKVCKKKNYLVNCADYGVPQTRIRRIFTDLPLPKPTHSEFPSLDLFGGEIQKWVSVRKALDLDGIIEDRKGLYFGETEYCIYSVDNPHHTILTGNRDWFISNSGHTKRNRENITRSIDEPSDTVVNAASPVLTNYNIKSLKKIRNRKMLEKHPMTDINLTSNTITSNDRDTCGDSVVTDGEYSRKLENSELAILQGFPKDYKWHGSKTSVRRQIGNAVPPPLIRAFGMMI